MSRETFAGVRTLYGSPASGSAAVEMGLRAAGLGYRVVRAAACANLHRAGGIFADEHVDGPARGAEPRSALALLAVVVSQWSGARKHVAQACTAFHELIERHPRPAAVPTEHRATRTGSEMDFGDSHARTRYPDQME